MADKNVNELLWVMKVDDQSAPGLSSFRKRMDDAAKQTPTGFLERLAASARENRMDQRRTGETALQQALSSPAGFTGMAADMLGIGMPMMVADSLGNMLNGATKKAVELRNELAAGKITSEEMARGFATSIPVLGNYVGFFLNIRELLTGEQAEIDRITESTKRQNALWEKRRGLMLETKTILEDQALLLARMQVQGVATYLGGTAGQRYAQIEQEKLDIESQRQAIARKVGQVERDQLADPELAKLHARRSAAAQKLSGWQEELDHYSTGTDQYQRAAAKANELRSEIASIETDMASLNKDYAGKRSAIEEETKAVDQREKNLKLLREANERAHQDEMLKISGDGLKARADAESAWFKNDRLGQLTRRYELEKNLLQQNIDAQQKEYDRIAKSADAATKEEMQGRIAAMKDQQQAALLNYAAERANIERERQYKAQDQAYEREDAQRRLDQLRQDFGLKHAVMPRYTFGLETMSSGQYGIAELYKGQENLDKDMLSTQKETREFARQQTDLLRDIKRLSERQQRVGVI